MSARYDWEMIQTEYETGATQVELARKHGVSQAAISQRARREGWMQDGTGEDSGAAGQTTVHARQRSAPLPTKNKVAGEGKNAIIRRHREEWNKIRLLVDDAVTEQDAEAAKLAKITAETLKIRQEGERKAWGITDKVETEVSGGLVLAWQK